MPCYLEYKEFITPDVYMLADFIKDRIPELNNKDKIWKIEISQTHVQYLGEYTE